MTPVSNTSFKYNIYYSGGNKVKTIQRMCFTNVSIKVTEDAESMT